MALLSSRVRSWPSSIVQRLTWFVASIVRTIGPAASTSLFAVSRQKNLLGGNLVYLVFVGVSALAVLLASKLPAEAWEMEEDQEREE
jgi:hypothetical protein